MYETKIVGKTDAGIEIFRITFDDGDWWELHNERTWGTSQAVRQATVGLDAEDDLQGLQMREATNLAAVVGSTVSWSWDAVITEQAIRDRSDLKVQAVTRELAERHLSAMVRTDDDEKKVSTWRRFKASLSRITGLVSTLIGRALNGESTSRLRRGN